ncbi:hypothetical protein POTOM_049782 [Populus tomentosa]|uniref:Uncharacterized protein n=1 Tax=Populus tomentosa TaxID=118781 RepID=A0A8X7YF36_POPTO|nr:hypothetical protein POTOM_049782 [Populus tomentosa]
MSKSTLINRQETWIAHLFLSVLFFISISETGDSTLIVNGTSSSQEEAEVSANYSWSHSPERDHAVATIQQLFKILAAAIRIQKHYRGFRTRRNLADSIIAAELLWQTTLFHIQKMGKLAITVNIESEKHIGSLLECFQYGYLSSDQLALLHCWETIYPRLRYSWNSHFFYQIWGDQCFLGSSKFDSYKVGDLKRRESIFTTGKPTSVQLRMNTASSTQVLLLGDFYLLSFIVLVLALQHSISELTKAWKTWKGALQQCLEVWWPTFLLLVTSANEFYNPCLLNLWINAFVSRSSSTLQISLWNWRLDVGDGKTVNHPECSREKLRQERNTYLELVSKLEAVESFLSLVLKSGSHIKKDINNNQREPDRADGFDQQASNSEAVQSPASLIHWRQRSFSAINVEEDLNNNQRTQNGPADGFNLKDLLRRIFYTMNLLFEIATAVLDYLSSQQRQPRYALSGMILSITVMAISLIQLAHTVGKEGVSLQWKGWIPRFYHPAPSNKPFGNLVQVVELLFSVSQCVFAIIAYHYLSRDQNNPAQFCIYPIAFAFCLLCLSFIRREP